MSTIIHLIDNLGLGGAQSMLAELYLAIKKYYPEYKQIVLSPCMRPTDKIFISSYGVPFSHAPKQKILSIILSKKKSVVIYHKLAGSRKELFKSILKRSINTPIVINHTLHKSIDWAGLGGYRMVAVSHHMKRKIQSWYPKVKCSVIHNAVDGKRYEDVKPRKVDTKGLLFTGRINRVCRWKHRDDWTKWCSNIKLPKKMIHEYIGDGPQYHSARNFAKKQRGKNSVKMMGLINGFEEKISILKSWDVFLYETVRNEGISMSILESLACGVPVICSNHYGNKEIIEKGINGFAYKDKPHAVEILSKLASDKSCLKELKKTTKEHFVNNLDIKICVEKYMGLIKKSLKK